MTYGHLSFIVEYHIGTKPRRGDNTKGGWGGNIMTMVNTQFDILSTRAHVIFVQEAQLISIIYFLTFYRLNFKVIIV